MKLLAPLTALAISACAAVPPPTVQQAPPCPVIASSDWTAWVNAMPTAPPGGPTLNVMGKVTLPSGSWVPTFTTERVMESSPVQVVVELDAQPVGSGVQVPVTREIRGSWPSEPKVGSVVVTCRGTALATISPVVTAY